MLKQNGVSEAWNVQSAGTWVAKKSTAHPAAVREGNRLGLDLGHHESREVTGPMIEGMDLVVVMTHGQKEALQIEFPVQQQKIVMLTELSNGLATDIPDPVETDFKDAEMIVNDLSEQVDHAYGKIIKRCAKSKK
jgi:protein-tyrosine-phosphatase